MSPAGIILVYMRSRITRGFLSFFNFTLEPVYCLQNIPAFPNLSWLGRGTVPLVRVAGCSDVDNHHRKTYKQTSHTTLFSLIGTGISSPLRYWYWQLHSSIPYDTMFSDNGHQIAQALRNSPAMVINFCLATFVVPLPYLMI